MPATAAPIAPAARAPHAVPLATCRARMAGLAAATALLGLCALASLSVGSLGVPFGEVIRAFTAYDGSDAHAIVRELRVPRTELGALVGAALGAAGALMQGTTRNPLAEPGILGVNAGAAFAVVVAIRFLGAPPAAAGRRRSASRWPARSSPRCSCR